jgi:hypothetical protein
MVIDHFSCRVDIGRYVGDRIKFGRHKLAMFFDATIPFARYASISAIFETILQGRMGKILLVR